VGSVVVSKPAPTAVFRTVPEQLNRIGKRHADKRTREYLTPDQMARLITTARKHRHGLRDSLMVMMAYGRALGSKEVVELEWSQVDFTTGMLTVNHAKKGLQQIPHPLKGDELRGLPEPRRAHPKARYVFLSERDHQQFTTDGFQKMIVRLGQEAKLGLPIHAHMLSHNAGFKLAQNGRDTWSLQLLMGDKNIVHTTHYTDRNAAKFNGWWYGRENSLVRRRTPLRRGFSLSR
jgi:integrase